MSIVNFFPRSINFVKTFISLTLVYRNYQNIHSISVLFQFRDREIRDKFNKFLHICNIFNHRGICPSFVQVLLTAIGTFNWHFAINTLLDLPVFPWFIIQTQRQSYYKLFLVSLLNKIKNTLFISRPSDLHLFYFLYEKKNH